VGIEPTHKGFADLSLTTWVPRLGRTVYRNRVALSARKVRALLQDLLVLKFNPDRWLQRHERRAEVHRCPSIPRCEGDSPDVQLVGHARLYRRHLTENVIDH
jgi:hypothetical protein